MGKAKSIFKNIRVIILLVFLALAVVAIHPSLSSEGVAIRSVSPESAAAAAGIESPKPRSTPMSKEVITMINNAPINDVSDYYDAIEDLEVNRTVHIKTDKELYKLTTRPAYKTVTLNETEIVEVQEEVFDNETNTTKNITRKVEKPKIKKIPQGMEDIGLSVYDAPSTNLRKGLDLQGGTRVLLQPEEELEDKEMQTLIDNMKYRLNVYGLSDIIVREAGDLSGNQYIMVEIAGAKESEVKELISKQGKFQATIDNETVFRGGEDITYVCRSAECAGIDPQRGCGKTGDGRWACTFQFSISLSPAAAERQAEMTKDLDVITDQGDSYLSKKLELYLDDSKVDELSIGADLKGRAVTDIAISGSDVGTNQEQAMFNSLENMKQLQTVLITGSLPVKLEIVKTDVISPFLGEEFLRNAIYIGLFSLLGVVAVIFIRYRMLKIAIPMALNSLIEVVLLLGFASLIGWNLDLAAIAGVIIAVGTGVDHLIVINDGILSGKGGSEIYDWKKRIKSAFFIIMAAYFTTVVAMLPLWFAGAGLLKGFALITIAGVSIGVLLTRPAYAAVVEILLKE